MIPHRTRGSVAAAVVIGLSLPLTPAPPAGAYPVTPREADEDFAVASHAVDNYWRRHWSDFFTGGGYSSPGVVGVYDSRLGAIPCNDDYGTSNNAWYCGATDSVGFDLMFMEAVYDLGDSFIYLVVAHEWGHAVQARLSDDLVARQRELQADCLAGAALSGAARDGTIEFEDGDAGELINSLNAVADEYPWTTTGDHGNGDERISAFRRGFGGPEACFP